MPRARLESTAPAPVAPRSDPLGLLLLLDTAPDGIIRLDPSGRITFMNRTAADMLGLTPDEAVDRPIWTYVQFLESAAQRDAAAQRGYLVGGVTVLERGQEMCWREDGTRFPIEYEVALVRSAAGADDIALTFRDISRRRTIETAKDELIALTSHELRSPLTSIRSALGLLDSGLAGPASPQARRLIQIALTSTDRLIRLVNELLDIERIDAGQVQLRRIPCAIGDLLQDATDALRLLAEEAGVKIVIAPVQATVLGDADRLLQVLINLLANAIKFSPARGATVWLDVDHVDSEVILRVRDEGRGIPPAKLESIFERFVQVDMSDARDKGGTGLGLAIARSIIKQHGGQIWAESTVGVGTTICIALPAFVGTSAGD